MREPTSVCPDSARCISASPGTAPAPAASAAVNRRSSVAFQLVTCDAAVFVRIRGVQQKYLRKGPLRSALVLRTMFGVDCPAASHVALAANRLTAPAPTAMSAATRFPFMVI
jgi:hypothetical protein